MRLQALHKVISRPTCLRGLSSKAAGSAPAPSPARKSSSPEDSGVGNIASVSGVTANVCRVPNTEVGPGASKSSAYKNPEYFCYNEFSFAEAEVEMIKFRLPQPSSNA